MQVLVKAPGKEPETREIPSTLEGMQGVVGGHIEFLSFNGLAEHGITVYANEDGKYDDRCKPNVLLETWTGVYGPDVLCGTFFLCGSKGDRDVSLTTEQLLIGLGWLKRLKALPPEHPKTGPEVRVVGLD